jgi:hypothetical protein
MKKKPTFTLYQSVCSAPDSSDIKLMNMTWHAVITDVIKCKTQTPDGYCYVTVGFWSNERRHGRRATLRQLWSNHLALDMSDKAMQAS